MPPYASTLARAVDMYKRSPAQILRGEFDVERRRGAERDAAAAGTRTRYLRHLDEGEDALNRYIAGATEAGMPTLRRELQGVREGAISRGVGLGELGTSYEGDVVSAFQRNIANAAAGQAMNLYGTQAAGYGDVYGTDVELGEASRNRYLDLLTGQRDFDAAQAAERRRRRGGFWGAVGSVAGGIGGFALGGPAGAAAGARIGGSVGSGFGG